MRAGPTHTHTHTLSLTTKPVRVGFVFGRGGEVPSPSPSPNPGTLARFCTFCTWACLATRVARRDKASPNWSKVYLRSLQYTHGPGTAYTCPPPPHTTAEVGYHAHHPLHFVPGLPLVVMITWQRCWRNPAPDRLAELDLFVLAVLPRTTGTGREDTGQARGGFSTRRMAASCAFAQKQPPLLGLFETTTTTKVGFRCIRLG